MSTSEYLDRLLSIGPYSLEEPAKTRVLLPALDRLTREGIGIIMQLFNTFRTYGVQVISHQEPWLEQAGPMADLLTAIAGWAAQFESARRSERIKAAFARKRARGEPIGRKPGAKDVKPRKRMGYMARYKDRRKKAPRKSGGSIFTNPVINGVKPN